MNIQQFFRNFRARFNKAFNRGRNKKSAKKMKADQRSRNDDVLARRVVTIGVMVSVVMVSISLFVALYYNSEAVAKRKFVELVKTYYEDYYYDKFTESVEADKVDEQLAKAGKNGCHPGLLRQLLLYQNGKYSSYRGYFEKDDFNCDKNTTSATIYPVEPYGRTDYTVKYFYDCD